MVSTKVRCSGQRCQLTWSSGEPQLITKHIGSELSLSDRQLQTNTTISFYRQRVEHIMVH